MRALGIRERVSVISSMMDYTLASTGNTVVVRSEVSVVMSLWVRQE
jgi:hypothetical protein